MKLTKEQLLHIAKLARINLSEKELAEFPDQLGSILEYVDMLGEVDTDNVEETSQVTGLSHVLRKDEIQGCDNVEKLLDGSEYSIIDNQIAVNKVV